MADSISIRRALHPQLEPYATGFLPVSDLHTLYFEQAGNEGGIPVLCLHGGPGGGISPDMRRFFDPARWHMVLFDQRGCGKSTPHAQVEQNTTWDLVDDIEKLRVHLGIEKWAVFGGSWGSTLALAYAIKHPHRVMSLTLRGIFLVTKTEIDWFYQVGASHIFPDSFERYVSVIPPAERGDIVGAFHARLFSEDRNERIIAARAWARWEGDCLSMRGADARPTRFEDDQFVTAFARIENHYFVNNGFMPTDNWIIDNASALTGIPMHIVHGRYDLLTPMSSAWALKRALPSAELEIIGDAGHASLEPGIVDALLRVTDHFADRHGETMGT
jgi:proline iminopeptidase